MSYRFKVNIGDWSNDGHNQSSTYIIESSETNEAVQNAFISASTRLGLLTAKPDQRFVIADEYDEPYIKHEHAEILTSAGIDVSMFGEDDDDPDEGFYIEPGAFVHLLMQIAKLDLNFEYKIVNDEIPNFNGFWSSNLNVSMGYGLFSCD